MLKVLGLEKKHLTAIEMKDRYADDWDKMFKFSFVRNPWDKVVSHYHYRIKTNQTNLGTSLISFKEWVTKSYGNQDSFYYDNVKMFMPQTDWISDSEGNIMVDFVGRFEHINADFKIVCQRLKIQGDLPHLNVSSHQHYSHYYDDETKLIIKDWFQKDIENFNYSFEYAVSNA